MLAAQRQDPPLDPLVEEVRVAMALNGGVSLAIWMGGCAVELDCARRAHVGHEPLGAADAAVPDRTVYPALCSAFRRELVIDLMADGGADGRARGRCSGPRRSPTSTSSSSTRQI